MQKLTLICSLGVALVVAPGLIAQTKPPANATAAAPKGAHPKSAAERTDLNALNKMATDSATTSDQMDAAITSFVTKYPTSDYLSSVATFGLQFNQTPPHVNYEKSLLYGEQAIKADPNSLYALVTLGNIIPDQVKDTDLDHDQRVKEATDDDNAAIHLAETSGPWLNDKPFSDAAKHQAESIAYSSLARLATLNKDYAGAVDDYTKAIPLDTGEQVGVDYFYISVAQMNLKQYDKALVSLDAAQKAAPDNAALQAAVAHNRSLAQAALGKH